jgi:uncharacterized membrane protein
MFGAARYDGYPRGSGRNERYGRGLVYWPLAIPFLAIGFVAVLLLIAFVQIGIFSYALGRLGIGPEVAMLVLLASLAAVAITALFTHAVARPVRGLGIAVPALLPGIFAAAVAIVLHPVAVAGLAYVGGTLGTLVGADLLNMHKIRRLGAPVASIGGAGTFDGVFITGIVAVLLAAIF